MGWRTQDQLCLQPVVNACVYGNSLPLCLQNACKDSACVSARGHIFPLWMAKLFREQTDSGTCCLTPNRTPGSEHPPFRCPRQLAPCTVRLSVVIHRGAWATLLRLFSSVGELEKDSHTPTGRDMFILRPDSTPKVILNFLLQEELKTYRF